MPSDIEIIRRVREGRNQEFRCLIDRYQGRVYALAYRILGRREEAEDAVQDAFLRAYQGMGTFVDSNPLWPWLRRIAINCCLNKLPKEFPSDEVVQMVESEQPFVDTVQTEMLRRCDCQVMAKAISGLPASYRVVVVLRYNDDLSHSEIAELIGESAGTVRVRLHRALKMLFERLAVVQDEL